MQLTKQQLFKMKLDFHRNLYVLPPTDSEILLAMIEDKAEFVSYAPPMFCRDSESGYTLVAGHLSYVIMAQHLTMAVEVKVFGKGACPDRLVERFAKWDKNLYASLRADLEPPKASRPTEVRRKRLNNNQTCPFCDEVGEPSPLVSSKYWMKSVKDGKESQLSCPQCGASIIVTPDELTSFQKYQLPGTFLPKDRWKRLGTSTPGNEATARAF